MLMNFEPFRTNSSRTRGRSLRRLGAACPTRWLWKSYLQTWTRRCSCGARALLSVIAETSEHRGRHRSRTPSLRAIIVYQEVLTGYCCAIATRNVYWVPRMDGGSGTTITSGFHQRVLLAPILID